MGMFRGDPDYIPESVRIFRTIGNRVLILVFMICVYNYAQRHLAATKSTPITLNHIVQYCLDYAGHREVQAACNVLLKDFKPEWIK